MPLTGGEEERERALGAPRMALWQAILKAAASARYMPSLAAPARERASVGRGVGGCLMRLLLAMLLLLVVLVGAVFLFGLTLFQGN